MPTVYVDLSMINGQAKDLLDVNQFQKLSVREQASVIMASMLYLGKKDELGQPLYPITLWIACDLDRPDGRQLLLNALTYLKSHTHARLGLLVGLLYFWETRTKRSGELYRSKNSHLEHSIIDRE
jgi:hypothetical protein